MEKIPIKQHYVPVCYLKNFTINNTNLRNKNILTNFFQIKDCLLKTNISIKSICTKTYFYGEDGLIEKRFAVSEKKWSNLLKKIINSNKFSLTNEDISLLKKFIIWQYARTYSYYDHTNESLSELLNTINLNHKNINLPMSKIIENFSSNIKLINDLKIAIIKFQTKNILITSDNPVLNLNFFTPKNCGFANIGCLLMLPISPNILAILYDSKFYKVDNNFIISTNANDVVSLNNYQFFNSKERIISNDENILISYSQNQAFIDEKIRIQNREKTTTLKTNPGSIIAFHNPFIPCLYQLDFIKLPKSTTNIALDIRNSLVMPRTYDEKYYKKICAALYIISNRKNDSLNIYAGKDKKHQLSIYKKFIEDYWNLKLKDRIYDGKILKNIRIKRFPAK